MSEKVKVYAVGLIYMSVCVEKDASREEIELEANAQYPTGIKSKWKISEENFREGNTNPCTCNTNPERLHYLLSC